MLGREREGKEGGQIGASVCGDNLRAALLSQFFSRSTDRPTNRQTEGREREREREKMCGLATELFSHGSRQSRSVGRGRESSRFLISPSHARQDKCGHLASHSHSHSLRDFSRRCYTLRPACLLHGSHARVMKELPSLYKGKHELYAGRA